MSAAIAANITLISLIVREAWGIDFISSKQQLVQRRSADL
jgi:hypothetical protein